MTLLTLRDEELVDASLIHKDPYDLEMSFERRIARAIHRYERTQVKTELEFQVFKAYMTMGHIRLHNKPPALPAEYDASPPLEEEGLETIKHEGDTQCVRRVDFYQVAARFFVVTMIRNAYFRMAEAFPLAGAVVKQFIAYLERLNVCPEYAEDLTRAKNLADKAIAELPVCKRMMMRLPSERDIRISMLYGGKWFGAFDYVGHWTTIETMEQMVGVTRARVQEYKEQLEPGRLICSEQDLLVRVEEVVGTKVNCRVVESHSAHTTVGDVIAIHIPASVSPLVGMYIHGLFAQLDSTIGWFMEQIILVWPSFYTKELVKQVDYEAWHEEERYRIKRFNRATSPNTP
jgi:hypothetical protein